MINASLASKLPASVLARRGITVAAEDAKEGDAKKKPADGGGEREVKREQPPSVAVKVDDDATDDGATGDDKETGGSGGGGGGEESERPTDAGGDSDKWKEAAPSTSRVGVSVRTANALAFIEQQQKTRIVLDDDVTDDADVEVR